MTLMQRIKRNKDLVPEKLLPSYMRDSMNIYIMRFASYFTLYFILLYVFLVNVYLIYGISFISMRLLTIVCLSVPMIVHSVYFFVIYAFYKKYGGFMIK